MNLHCPNCGCTNSLDALLSFNEASKAFAAAIKLHGKLGTPLINYLGLFRSPNRALKFDKALKLLGELTPDIHAQQITINRHTHPAPETAWVWAINTMLDNRNMGKLDTPLPNHNYLYKVIASYKPDQHIPPHTHQPNAKTAAELAADQAEHERHKHEKPKISLAEMIAKAQVQKSNTEEKPHRGLKNIPTTQLLAHINKNKRDDETTEECYQRLKALETQMEETT